MKWQAGPAMDQLASRNKLTGALLDRPATRNNVTGARTNETGPG